MEDQAGDEIITEKLNQKMKEAKEIADKELSPIDHHVQFTLQKAYFKCAYECYDKSSSKDDVEECAEYCSVPVLKALYLFEDEVTQFQDRLKGSMRVCKEKYEAAKNLQESKLVAMDELDSCLNQSVKESIEELPHIVERLKHFLSID